jgi:hypothetical protein
VLYSTPSAALLRPSPPAPSKASDAAQPNRRSLSGFPIIKFGLAVIGGLHLSHYYFSRSLSPPHVTIGDASFARNTALHLDIEATGSDEQYACVDAGNREMLA